MGKKKTLALISSFILILTVFSSCKKTSVDEENTSEPNSVSEIQYMAEFQGIAVLSACRTDGNFVEDGSDTEKNGVAGIVVMNTTDKTLQYMEITETFADGTIYTYAVSTLPPDTAVTVQEKSGAEHKGFAPDSGVIWSASNTAFFTEEPMLHEDMIKVTGADSILNVQNITDKDITDNIVIYYKNYKDGEILGGITYRVIVSGGVEAGGIKQIPANHYKPGESIIMFTEFVSAEVSNGGN